MEIIHSEADGRFETRGPGQLGFLVYRIDGHDIHLLHVEVAPDARGQGVAAELTRAALEFAKARSLNVIPVCGYVKAYLRRHPKAA